MFQRNYTVKGEDVNDFMVMQNAAFLKYSSKLLDTFLHVNGFTGHKLNKQKVGLQKKNDVIHQNKPLLFTQHFSIALQFRDLFITKNTMVVDIHFFDAKNVLTTTITRELLWFDYENWQTIAPPKSILKYFNQEKELRKVG